VSYEVEFIGGRSWDSRVQVVPYLGTELLRPIAFRSGVFIEHYRPELGMNGWVARYTHINRSAELARHFDPTRLR
jgi:hypothetical protein